MTYTILYLPKEKNFIKFVLYKLHSGESQSHSGILELVNNIAQELLKHRLNDNNEEYKCDKENASPTYATSTKQNIVDSGILLVGFQTRISEEAYGSFSICHTCYNCRERCSYHSKETS
jgi:hypothetical protein